MPIALTCPNCQANFRLADEMAGKKVKCKSCQQLFVVAAGDAPAPALDMELDDKPAETAISTKPAPPKPKENPDDAIEEAAPKAPSKPPPLKKSSSSTERPTVKARRKPVSSGSGGMTAVLLVLLGGGFLLCVGGMCVVGYVGLASHPAPNPPQPPLPGPGPIAVVQPPPQPLPPQPIPPEPPPPKPPEPPPLPPQPPVVGPDVVGKSFVVNTLQLEGFQAMELALPANIGPAMSPNNNQPVWDAQGQSLYWLVNNNTLHKISREGKLEATAALPGICHQLALSSEGLVTLAQGVNEAWVIDPQTLAVKTRIPCAGPHRWLGASPSSAMVLVLISDLYCLDLKTQRFVPVQFQGGPANRVIYRGLALSPDGKFMCAQFVDYACQRYRVEGVKLQHDGSKTPYARAPVVFQFSPDSKQVVMTHPNLSMTGAKKVSQTEVFATEAWDKPAYTLPGYVKLAAIDAKGGLYATVDRELRYYADPAGANVAFQTLAVPQPARRLLTPPQGVGCLTLAPQCYLVQPAAKR